MGKLIYKLTGLGIIRKQALRTTLITIIGISVGMLSRSIMPFILSKDEIGTLALLDSISSFIAIIFCLGFPQITLKLFPSFRNDSNGHNGYLGFAFLLSLIGATLGWLCFYIFKYQFVGNTEASALIQLYSYLVYPLIFFGIFFRNIDIYLRMVYKSVLGIFAEGLLLKITILTGMILFWIQAINFQNLVYVYAVALSLPGIILILYAIKSSAKFTFPNKEAFPKQTRAEMYNYGLFGILASASGIIIITIDQLMLNRLLGTEAVGVYSVMFFAGILVSTPSRGVRRIASTVIAESWKEKDLTTINSIYSKSAITLLITGQFLFIMGWACLKPVLTFLPQYYEGIYVFFFIGLAQLIDMMTGVNQEIIATSSKYKYNTYFNIFLAIISIVTNYYFISEWGIVGAACASTLSIFIINSLKWHFLKRKFKLQPFTKQFFLALGIGFTLFLIVSIVPINLRPIPLIIFYLITITAIYWFVIHRLNLSEDISKTVSKLLVKFKMK